nr:NlpC/P60 family protein [Halobacillus sp. Marseille-Q1614]
MGAHYNLKGSSPEDGFNSGGFVYHVYKEVTGSWRSKHPSSQFEAGMNIERDELEPGDIVFLKKLISGIYSVNDEFIISTPSGEHPAVNRIYLYPHNEGLNKKKVPF